MNETFKNILSSLPDYFLQWERLRHPYAGWLRLALLLALIVGLWTHHIFLLVLTIVALLIHPWWFPAYVDAGDDTPLMTRLTDAVHRWWHDEEKSCCVRAMTVVPALLLLPPLVAFIWGHDIFWGGYFLLAVLGYKAAFLYGLLRKEEQELIGDGDSND